MLEGLPPVLPENPHLLVLGSMPSAASLQAQQYYAHPRNAFWPILLTLAGTPQTCDYQKRLNTLKNAHIALWDVLGACERQGSLDSAIIPGSEQINDIARLLQIHGGIRAIALNGGKAHRCFSRHIAPQLDKRSGNPAIIPLPSTSPAHARMSLADKQEVWQTALAPYLRTPPRQEEMVGLEGFEPPTKPL